MRGGRRQSSQISPKSGKNSKSASWKNLDWNCLISAILIWNLGGLRSESISYWYQWGARLQRGRAVVKFTQPAASGGGKNLSLFWQNLRMVFSSICSSGWGIGQKVDARLFPIHNQWGMAKAAPDIWRPGRKQGWEMSSTTETALENDLKNDLLSGQDGKLKF